MSIFIIETTSSRDKSSVRYGLFEGSNPHITGLTKEEMQCLCEEYELDFEELIGIGRVQCR